MSIEHPHNLQRKLCSDMNLQINWRLVSGEAVQVCTASRTEGRPTRCARSMLVEEAELG